MGIMTFIFWLYIVPMGVVLLPGTLAFHKLGDMEGVRKADIQFIAVFPLINLYSAFRIIDVVLTSTVDYIRNGHR